MASIHYFQRYSQKENVVTNNTLLLFSRLYDYNISKFKIFINELIENSPSDEIGVQFEQQKKVNAGGVPDGYISQESFKIVIETKMHSGFSLLQLISHLKAFKDEKIKILLSLCPESLEAVKKSEIKYGIEEFNNSNNTNIFLATVTFENVIKCFKSVLADYDLDMNQLIEDYEGFCIECGILPLDKYRMRAITSSWSLDENFDFGIYYDLASRPFQKHRYIGLYAHKSVVGLGEIVNIVVANLNNNIIEVIESSGPVSQEQKDRIKGIMSMAKEQNGWDIEKNHRFFVVHEFYKTDFKKITKYPIQRTRYFNLKDELGISDFTSTEQIAKILEGKTWE